MNMSNIFFCKMADPDCFRGLDPDPFFSSWRLDPKQDHPAQHIRGSASMLWFIPIIYIIFLLYRRKTFQSFPNQIGSGTEYLFSMVGSGSGVFLLASPDLVFHEGSSTPTGSATLVSMLLRMIRKLQVRFATGYQELESVLIKTNCQYNSSLKWYCNMFKTLKITCTPAVNKKK